MDDQDLYDDRVTEIVDLAAARGFQLALAPRAGGWEAFCVPKQGRRPAPVSSFARTRTEAAERALAGLRLAA